MIRISEAGALALAFALFAAPMGATTVPFVEGFDASSEGWFDATLTAPLDFVASGGPDGSSYVSGSFDFASQALDDTPVILRGHDEFGASGGNLFGDWLADDVGLFTAQVRHDAPVPLTFFVRFSGPFNFPGGVAIEFAPVFSNTWSEIGVELKAANPQFVSFEGQSFADVFSNVGHIQIGVSVPAALAGLDQEFHFDLDLVSIAAAEPGLLAVVPLALVALRRPRR